MISWRRLLFVVALFVAPRAVVAADLSINPSVGQTTVGAIITTTIQLDTDGQAVNAVETTLTFPTDLLQLITVSKTGSILTLAKIDSAAANRTGQVMISGGLPSPGYTGDQGIVLRMTWQARAAGQAAMTLSKGSILANDGVGTNVFQSQSGATFTLVDPVITEPSISAPVVGSLDYPNQFGWYSGPEATIFWTRPPGLTGVSYSLTRESTTKPDETIDTEDAAVIMPISEDGVWYFHLRGRYASGWSETAHFTLRRDNTPPEPFTIDLVRDRGSADPSPSIVFSTTDRLSGLAGYTASIDSGPASSATSPLQLEVNRTGDYHVVVTARDLAGNSRTSDTAFTVAGYTVPIITHVSTPLILLGQLTVRGTALAGDRINIFVDGKLSGSTMAGTASLAVTDGTTVRLPWTYTTDQPFSPGAHRLTATATGPAGQTSIASDPQALQVQGSRIQFGGRTVATFAAVPLLGLLLVLLLAAMAGLVWWLRQSLKQFERRRTMVDQDLQILRQAVDRGQLDTKGIENALTIIDNEVVGSRRRKNRPAGRMKKLPNDPK